jgi:hypothetical protein
MKNQEKETPSMKATTKWIAVLIALVVFLPALIRWLSELLVPVAVLVVLLLIARVVWFYTRV